MRDEGDLARLPIDEAECERCRFMVPSSEVNWFAKALMSCKSKIEVVGVVGSPLLQIWLKVSAGLGIERKG